MDEITRIDRMPWVEYKRIPSRLGTPQVVYEPLRCQPDQPAELLPLFICDGFVRVRQRNGYKIFLVND